MGRCPLQWPPMGSEGCDRGSAEKATRRAWCDLTETCGSQGQMGSGHSSDLKAAREELVRKGPGRAVLHTAT